MQIGDRLLLFGGGLTGVASLLHVAIILGGPDWYRFFGAGERMARLAARGSTYPTVLTASIAVVLGLWTLYALSGAGLIRRPERAAKCGRASSLWRAYARRSIDSDSGLEYISAPVSSSFPAACV